MLALAKRTQVVIILCALIWAVAAFVLGNLVESYQASQGALSGPLAPLKEAFGNILVLRYELGLKTLAWAGVGTVFTVYLKERKKLLRLF